MKKDIKKAIKTAKIAVKAVKIISPALSLQQLFMLWCQSTTLSKALTLISLLKITDLIFKFWQTG